MKNVYVVNKSSHDFSDAKRFGEIVYLSEGSLDRFGVNNMARLFKEKMEGSSPNDYIVLCSLNSMNALATAVFVHKHGTLNLLLFKDGRGYIERNIVL